MHQFNGDIKSQNFSLPTNILCLPKNPFLLLAFSQFLKSISLNLLHRKKKNPIPSVDITSVFVFESCFTAFLQYKLGRCNLFIFFFAFKAWSWSVFLSVNRAFVTIKSKYILCLSPRDTLPHFHNEKRRTPYTQMTNRYYSRAAQRKC